MRTRIDLRTAMAQAKQPIAAALTLRELVVAYAAVHLEAIADSAREVDSIVSMPSIPASEPSSTWVTWVSMISADAPG